MTFYQKHLELIHTSLHIKALEVAQITNDYQGIEDYEQDMRVYFLKRADKYDRQRSRPQTFIARIAEYAKLQILRKLRAKKNIMIRNAERLDND